MSCNVENLPIAVIGAGPIGLSAAVNLLDAGLTPIVFESGDCAGSNIANWAHVRMFSPWAYNMDPTAISLLKETGWTEPALTDFPTGRELLDRYVLPLASHEKIAPHLHLNTRVDNISRQYHDVLRNDGREDAAFVVRVSNADGERDILVRAIIDASGTYQTPNWLGAHGIPAIGELAASSSISYGVPNILGARREQFAGKTVLVIGGGHSAYNALQDLVKLSEQAQDTRILWGIRQATVDNIVRSPKNDELQERRRLEVHIQTLLEEGKIEVFTHIAIEKIQSDNGKLVVHSHSKALPPVDEIIAATGFRPNLALLSELRIAIDPATQSPVNLGPLIDPNLHTCGSVPEHGVAELSHPESGLYVVGIKSYGRAPTFLLKTGYKQVKSVTSLLANQGDIESAVANSPLSCDARVPGSCCSK
ncbi:NAD(P)-binding domain-containing protein [Aestuariibacter sp. A3R04]|uniref:NAD(P)-binding domain-containing protein n=1 Tax=Aestuariibacter sp. A3R04 TaxID=2841571 RepID=UPI001C09678C|nr:NAD(P)-binding domain-containing protein [Aestuariibacter sp. A3R04]MBU3021822.1 NAD(P)-binding domain-containing protein [Aestuariibacter sp. A3R04]